MNESNAVLVGIGAVILFIVIAVYSSMRLEKANCEARWVDSGRKYDWSVYGGCRVSDKNGNMIPEENVRDTN